MNKKRPNLGRMIEDILSKILGRWRYEGCCTS